MDRGVKIAIFVASIAALSLGLIWDRVLSSARVIVEKAPTADPFAAEEIPAFVRSESQRVEFPPKVEEPVPARAEQASGGAAQPDVNPEAPPPQPDAGWTEYRVKSGEGWWAVAHQAFKGRGLTTNDLIKANPGVEALKEGQIIRIPPAKR